MKYTIDKTTNALESILLLLRRIRYYIYKSTNKDAVDIIYIQKLLRDEINSEETEKSNDHSAVVLYKIKNKLNNLIDEQDLVFIIELNKILANLEIIFNLDDTTPLIVNTESSTRVELRQKDLIKQRLNPIISNMVTSIHNEGFRIYMLSFGMDILVLTDELLFKIKEEEL